MKSLVGPDEELALMAGFLTALRADAEGFSRLAELELRLQGSYAARLAGMPPRTRAVLLMLALDDTGGARLLAAARADLGPAEQARLIEVRPGRVTFRHPLIRTAVAELSTSDERRLAHLRLAEVLAGQPDRRAWHLGEAASAPDETVAALLEQAAGSILARGDGPGAGAALVRAAQLSPAAADRARRLARAACVAAAVTGDLRGAESLLADARHAQAGQGSDQFAAAGGPAEAAVAAALILLHGDGEVATAHRLLGRVLEAAGELSPAAATEVVRALMLVAHFGGGDERWAAPGDRLAGQAPAALRLSAAVADPARCPRAALDGLDAEIESLAHQASPVQIVRVAAAASFTDRLAGCRQALHRIAGEGTGASSSAGATVISARILLALEAFATGQWDEAQRLAEAAAGLGLARGYRLLCWEAHAMLAFLAAARGDSARARTLADEVIRWAAPRGVGRLQDCARYAGVLAALADADFETAYQLAVAISPAGQLTPHQPLALWVPLDLVEAALRTGRSDEAQAHVRALREAGVAGLSPRLALLAGAAAAMVAPDDQAAAGFERALAVPGASRWPLDLARVQLLHGERLRRLREMTRARAQLAAALEAFRRLGAGAWAARAAQELRATGQARPRGEQPECEVLTPAELEIAQLAASGLSNKQIGTRLFLSHRTVGAHLYRVFPKLGITSRAALRDALACLPGE
jgi:DNA-binding CsgD family transcriptional regulator